MFAYTNLIDTPNRKPGIAEFALLAPVGWFAADGIKSPVAPFASPGDSITIKTPHEFLEDKAFLKYDLAPQKNQLDGKTIGDLGFNSLSFEATIFLPGSSPAQHENIQNILNVKLIALVKDSNCGSNMYYQLGCDCTFAYLTVDFSTGTTNNGVKGFNGKLIYDGAIQFYAVDGGPELLP